LGKDNLALDAGGVKQVDSILHSCCKSYVLNIKTFCTCCYCDEIAIPNPTFKTRQILLWNEKEGMLTVKLK
jgi:hypothetical protein